MIEFSSSYYIKNSYIYIYIYIKIKKRMPPTVGGGEFAVYVMVSVLTFS